MAGGVICALAIFLVAAVSGAPIGRPDFPLFMQCDPRWGADQMGVPGPGERSTICGEGCAMSSLSMASNGLGITLPGGQLIDPGTMNAFLVSHSLYHCDGGDCNNLRLNAIEAASYKLKLIGENPKPTYSAIAAGLANESVIYLAHVHNNHHFILLLQAIGNDTFTVHDPFYPVSTYPYSNISDIIMYSIMPAPWVNIPTPYPLFKQCDPTWANDVMINQTVCHVGCLMSSVSMALRQFGIPINGQPATPGTFNAWLRTHGGYDSDNGLNEEVVPNINPSRIVWPADGMHRTNDLSPSMVRAYLLNGRVVIANVDNGGHFVLVTGIDWTGDEVFVVNDPGFDRPSYTYDQIVGWRIFDMK